MLALAGVRLTTRALRGQVRCATDATRQWAVNLNKPISETDPDVYRIMEDEKVRQRESLVLIGSENFTSKSVFDALGSVMSNKYSEGYPGARYYGGNENIDKVEILCQQRALEAFHLDPERWGVNVQPLSGSPANLQAYSAILDVHDRIMGLDLPDGGHLTHGFQTDNKKISASSVMFESMPYKLNESTGLIDYDKLEENSKLFRPKLLIAGASAYSRLIDWARLRQIADGCNAYLLTDMAHISGLVSAGIIPSPFEHSDIVTTTTHKSLRGPRGAMIFYRKGVRKEGKKGGAPEIYDLENKINFSVFPRFQGGPHNHTIAALATCLKQAQSNEFKEYQRQVVLNAKSFAKKLMNKGYVLVSGGTDNHLLLLNLKKSKSDMGMDGARVERVLELVNFAVNKNTVSGDVSAMTPGGIRMGTPALTSRGLTEEDFDVVAEFFDRAVAIACDVKKKTGSKLKDFKAHLADGGSAEPEIAALRTEIIEFAKSFPTVGF